MTDKFAKKELENRLKNAEGKLQQLSNTTVVQRYLAGEDLRAISANIANLSQKFPGDEGAEKIIAKMRNKQAILQARVDSLVPGSKEIREELEKEITFLTEILEENFC